MGVMRVLGIDPGYGRVGWAVLEGSRVKQEVVKYGCLETGSDLRPEERLEIIYEKMTELVDEFKPEEAAVEELFFFKNQKTVMQVGQARGVILVALKRAGLRLYGYTPLQVKQAVAGYGRADKRQVQMMVKAILRLSAVPKPDDAADAVAVGLTHFMFNRDLV